MKIAIAAGIAAACGVMVGALALAQSAPNPAMSAPDEFSWRLFIEVTSLSPNGKDPVFETWATNLDTFKPGATFPTGPAPLSLRPAALSTARAQMAAKLGKLSPKLLFEIAGVSEKSHRNLAAFKFIVDNGLNRTSGLKKKFSEPGEISFPPDAIELKSDWRPVSGIPSFTGNRVKAADVPKYFHVAKDKAGNSFALVSLHVISKQVPNWTWATFENRWNPGRCDVLGCNDAFGMTDHRTPPNKDPRKGYGDCVKSAELNALIKNAKWDAAFANYCLKGSQTDFTDLTGRPTRVGNSIPEGNFLATSSCITCHARAAWNDKGEATSDFGFVALDVGPIGPVDPSWVWEFSAGAIPPADVQPPPKRKGKTADFVWSILTCAYDDSDPAKPVVPCQMPTN